MVDNLVNEVAPVKRGRGRPKGSKNKPVQVPVAPVAPVQAPVQVPALPSMFAPQALAAFEQWLASKDMVIEGMVAEDAPVKRGRGRPKGSKNKPVPQVPVQAPVPKNFIQAEDAPVKRGRGRPKGSKNKPVQIPVQPVPVQVPAKAQRFRNVNKQGKKQSLKNLIINICARHKSGVKLQELSKLCWESGYRSISDEKGFVQNIRTNLAALMNNGVIVKDEDKKYHKQEVAG